MRLFYQYYVHNIYTCNDGYFTLLQFLQNGLDLGLRVHATCILWDILISIVLSLFFFSIIRFFFFSVCLSQPITLAILPLQKDKMKVRLLELNQMKLKFRLVTKKNLEEVEEEEVK